jgi:hypothetical protein
MSLSDSREDAGRVALDFDCSIQPTRPSGPFRLRTGFVEVRSTCCGPGRRLLRRHLPALYEFRRWRLMEHAILHDRSESRPVAPGQSCKMRTSARGSPSTSSGSAALHPLVKGGALAKRGGGLMLVARSGESPGTLHSATPFDKGANGDLSRAVLPLDALLQSGDKLADR